MYKVTNCFELVKEIFLPSKPKWSELTFTKEAYIKLMCYIHLIGEYEITGFGRVIDNKIVDIKILKQEVQQSVVDCDEEAMMEFLMSIPKEERGQWILDWHSHVNMPVFASGTDSTNYEEQYKARMSNQFPLLIVNKKQEYYAKCYVNKFKQTDIEILFEDKDITDEVIKEIYETCQNDIEQLCSKKVITYRQNKFGFGTTINQYNNVNYFKKNQQTEGEKLLEDLKNKNLDDYCISCATYLVDAEEYDRGICNECWAMMSPLEQSRYEKYLID